MSIMQNEAMQHAAIVTPGDQVQLGNGRIVDRPAIFDQIRHAPPSSHQLFKQAVQLIAVPVEPLGRQTTEGVVKYLFREVNDAIQPGLEDLPNRVRANKRSWRKYRPLRGESR